VGVQAPQPARSPRLDPSQPQEHPPVECPLGQAPGYREGELLAVREGELGGALPTTRPITPVEQHEEGQSPPRTPTGMSGQRESGEQHHLLEVGQISFIWWRIRSIDVHIIRLQHHLKTYFVKQLVTRMPRTSPMRVSYCS
jgi:hypothetical protein